MSVKKILIITLLTFLNVNAQKFELGKVSIEELQERRHHIDTSASAAILFKKGSTSFNLNSGYWEIETEVSFKIKIYKKEGLKYANYEVQYYIDGVREERVRFSNVYTYNLVEGKVVKTKLKSEGEFTKSINDSWKAKCITLPNVKEGSIIEFKYILNSPFIYKFNDWYFQNDIPTDYVEYNVFMIKYFIYNTFLTGYEKINLKSEPISFSDYGDVKHTYSKQNVRAIKEEVFVDNIDNYTSILKFNLASVEFPDKPIENKALDWEGVAKTIYEDQSFGDELKKTGYFEDDVKAIITGLTKRDEKIFSIFDFVKSKIKWNNKKGYYCKDGVKSAYKSRIGNVAEINLMLTSMLRYAGIDANPVLLSTKNNGVSIFPSLTAFDYVVAGVEVEDDIILLDATEKYSLPNVLPLRDLNWYGRLIRKNGTSSQVELSPKIQSNDIANLAYTLKTDGSIEGKIRRQISNHNALSFRQKYLDLTTENYLEKLEANHKNIEVSDYKRENGIEILKPIIETYAFKDTKSLEIIGNKMYLSPLIFDNVSENPFKQEKREYPVDFGYPMFDKFNINIDIPEGYTVETLPAAANLAMPENMGSFKYLISNTGNKIQVQITTEINTAIVTADYYESLKEFFKRMIDKQNEKIVLVKK
jgi:hypothetical protein